MQQYQTGNNMTDVIMALSLLTDSDSEEKTQALEDFYNRWKEDALVIDKWFSIQATSRLPGTLSQVKALTEHEAFNIKNPNKVRSLITAFCSGNAAQFHDISGEGYRFGADYVLQLDTLNPQISARLVGVFTLWRKYDEQRQKLMKAELERIAAKDDLSKDVYEIVSKNLA
jgi:aminopeptidase N